LCTPSGARTSSGARESNAVLPAPEAGGLTVSLTPDVPPCQPGAVPSTVELTNTDAQGR